MSTCSATSAGNENGGKVRHWRRNSLDALYNFLKTLTQPNWLTLKPFKERLVRRRSESINDRQILDSFFVCMTCVNLLAVYITDTLINLFITFRAQLLCLCSLMGQIRSFIGYRSFWRCNYLPFSSDSSSEQRQVFLGCEGSCSFVFPFQPWNYLFCAYSETTVTELSTLSCVS